MDLQSMTMPTTERVRLSRDDASRLRRLAREHRATKSEVFREALRALEREDRRKQDEAQRAKTRREAFDQLIRWAKEVPGDDIKWEGRL